MLPKDDDYTFRFTSHPTKEEYLKQPEMIDKAKPENQENSVLEGIQQLNSITMRYGLLSDDFCIFT